MLTPKETERAAGRHAKHRAEPATGAQGRLDDERVEAAAIIVGFQAAQQEIESSVDVAAVPARTAAARRHLDHVAVSGRRYGAGADKAEVKRAADSFDQALQKF